MQQGPNESFTDYIARWRRKVREMIDRPSEEEQIAIIRKNLRPNYQRMMSVVTKSRLDKFIQAGTQVEDTLKDEISSEPKVKRFGKEHVNYVSNGQGQQRPFQLHSNRSSQQNQQSQGYRAVHSSQRGDHRYGSNRPKREFSKLNHPMSALLAGLVEAGGKISMEGVQAPRKPNINTNPLPNHQMEGQKNVNYVGTEEPVDPTKLIRRRETTEVAAVYSTQPDRSSEYQLGESSQRPLTLSELAARGKKLELERQWPIQTKEMVQEQEREQENPVPEINPVMKEQPKKTPLFTVNQGTPVGFEKMQKEKTFRIEDLLKPPIDLKESLIPKTQGHVWADPFKTNSESVEDCQEVQHQTRAGKIFKPAHLRTDNPAATARGPLFQIPSDEDMTFQEGTTRTVKGFDNGKRTVTVQERANHKGKNIVPVIEPVRTLCNYTEEAINVLQASPMIREKIPSRFEYGNRRVAYLLRKHRFFPGMGLGRCQQGITQPLGSQAVAPKGHCSVEPTFIKKMSVFQKEAVLEKAGEVAAPDDTLLAGISLLYLEAGSEQEAIPSINMISGESELDDTATSSQRRMTAEEYIASRTQWANATEYRTTFLHPKKQRTEVKYPGHSISSKKRMTAGQYRKALQLARKKKIANTSHMLVDAYYLSLRQAHTSVTLDMEAEMAKNTSKQSRAACKPVENQGVGTPFENVSSPRYDNQERSKGEPHKSLADTQWVNMISEETDLQPHLFVRSINDNPIVDTNHFAGESSGATTSGTQKKIT
ncbi:hypothetical protein BVC80_733g32 [Macleaya cordata]|uniref:G-patch domain n=1 Tax=Macleaya cordata TaxID=56857 RepID=A0A200PY77_MACCD|nr:hypothetical protein BVC80_733g32 [Macleaya cordata]